MIPLFLFNGTNELVAPIGIAKGWPIHLGELRRRDVLQELEFVSPRVEVPDLVSRCFQLSFQIEDLRTPYDN